MTCRSWRESLAEVHAILHADQPAQLFEVSLDDMDSHWQQFERRLREFERRRLRS
ncbi:hypothetical protein VB780_09810 [Leptolyngbya sp. CCNP1308]|uniref:hypothetical protein n=1 Tax=Leptolyngbya sp. CCNP1308 TaxID=3110255 RepID=UPI002B1FEF3C|nr:hypothetical protein [Leptolyngbya sp. CCNP1308]MEA5448863.1 hypothetical protein [Leptolyngbya sp. CCNP1308]